MVKYYVLKHTLDIDNEKDVFEWKQSENYKGTEYVLITKNDKPMTILVPIKCQDMGASWYEHKKIELYRFKWEKEWIGAKHETNTK